MAKTTFWLTLAACLALGGCGGSDDPPPEEFALEVTRCVAENDWNAYRQLTRMRSEVLATDGNPTATRQTFRNLAGAEAQGVRRDFDRVVRAQVVRAERLPTYAAVVHATEPDRWVLHVQDAEGNFTGLEMTLVRSGDGYHVATLFAR